MTQQTTETPAEEKTDEHKKPPMLHIYCLECAKHEAVVKSFCKAKSKPSSILNPDGYVPEGLICQVCYDLAYQPCPKCGC